MGFSVIIEAMRKHIAVILILTAALSAYGAAVDYNALDSPINSIAYSGRIYDLFSNPAALPLMERDIGMFALRTDIRDSYSVSDFGHDGMSWVQNQAWTIDASFITRYVALTAYYGTEFSRQETDSPVYNIYSSLKIELNAAYSVPFFSVGLRISGGNEMIRRHRDVSNILDYFSNALFSPFERNVGSEFFHLGAGAILDFPYVSLAIFVEDILTLTDGGSLYFGWDVMAETTTVAAAVEGPRFNSDGDLLLVRPRFSFSFTGLMDAASRSIEFEGDLTFQFLPDADLTIAASYLERQHEWLAFNPENAVVSFLIRGGADGFYGSIGVSFKASDWTEFSPCISFSWIT